MKAIFCSLRPFNNNRGMALLITIMVVSLLIALTVQFARTMRHHYFGSATTRDGLQLHMIAWSANNIGVALVEEDGQRNSYDTFMDSWADIDPELFQEVFARGELGIEVQDLSGKLQINSLVQQKQGGDDQNNANENREILNRLLLSGTLEIEDESKAREIIDALVDWIDPDDRESDFGAESGYYRSLDEPYECANGPVAVIEDLLKVKGITPELLFGHGEKKGLVDFITVYGDDGKININTAGKELLQAMAPQVTEELTESLDEYRREEVNYENLENSGWYKTVSGWPGDITLSENVVTTASSFFKLMGQGTFNDQKREIITVIERDKEEGIMTWYKKVQ